MIVSNNYRTYLQGKKMFERGEVCPSKPSDDDEEWSREVLLWCGYRVAMAHEFDERCKVAEQIGMPRPEWEDIFKERSNGDD